MATKVTRGDILTMKNGDVVRIVRIKAGNVWVQPSNFMQQEGVPDWVNGFTSYTFQEFANRVAR